MLLGLARPSSGGIITARYAYGEIWDFFQTDSAIIDTLRIVAIFVLVRFVVMTFKSLNHRMKTQAKDICWLIH